MPNLNYGVMDTAEEIMGDRVDAKNDANGAKIDADSDNILMEMMKQNPNITQME